ncbi:DgyrCDS10205 [Dimorphilus gyrociliatus]|uniref:DgyrCDS10205 n=1 Tax=Dimorphilus gyrociliatus TaxID=2664684 RepID=A0A7I8W234_9ANNE|nr:DgyrCDS10205 [Dimorphilus gyrociliatus]
MSAENLEKTLKKSLKLSIEVDNESLNEICDELNCLLCEYKSRIPFVQEYMTHLLQKHRIIITNYERIPYLPWYLIFWRKQLKINSIDKLCNLDTMVDSSQAYILSEDMPLDKELRLSLQSQHLKTAIKHLEEESKDKSFSHMCLFCKYELHNSNPADLLNHMSKYHHLNIGLPQNIVYKREMIMALQKKLDNLNCLYCNRTFKDRNCLKDHMRKKNHKRLNSNSTEWDKYYIINYLEIDQNWKSLKNISDDNISEESDHDENWDDWKEDDYENNVNAVCLICPFKQINGNLVLHHMENEHNIKLTKFRHQDKTILNFYERVKLVNYIRRQITVKTCPFCLNKLKDSTDFENEIDNHSKSCLKWIESNLDENLWNQPQYYFSTYDDDLLLCSLDSEDDSPTTANNQVIAEDLVDITDSVLNIQTQENLLLN